MTVNIIRENIKITTIFSEAITESHNYLYYENIT